MNKRLSYLKKSLSKYSLKLDQKGYVANHDGNITVKIDNGYLATPTSEAKAEITDDKVITLDFEGKKIEGIGKPFSEMSLHLAAYQARPDAKAVIHAHPPFATARALTGQDIVPRLPEAIVSIGNVIPVTPYAMPGSSESLTAVKEALLICDVFMIAGNGVLSIGDDLEQAFLRLELIEHLAKIEFYACQMGAPIEIPQEDMQKLLEKRIKGGLGPQARNITKITEEPTTQSQTSVTDNIKNIIAEEIAKALRS